MGVEGIIIKIRVVGDLASYSIRVGDGVTLSQIALALLELKKVENKLLEIEKEFEPQYKLEG